MGIIKKAFNNILSEDMTRQARQVEIITVVVFIVMLAIAWWLWQFQIELTAPTEEGRQVIARMNIFELLFLKK